MENNFLHIVLGLVAAYLIGSIPTAIWYGKLLHGIDIRHFGSGNAGATNTFRTLGKKAGFIVMAFDIFKGWAATSLVYVLHQRGSLSLSLVEVFLLLFGVAATIGHIFPVYERFKGGKGIATLLGMLLSIQIEAALICMMVFFIVLILSKYVSLGSMISALAFPLMLLFIPRFRPDHPIIIIFGFCIFLIVVITHKKNIVRLINGEENKTFLVKKKSA